MPLKSRRRRLASSSPRGSGRSTWALPTCSVGENDERCEVSEGDSN